MILGRNEILRRLNTSETEIDKDRIIITPLLDLEDQIGRIEVDLRLGSQFIIFKEHFQGSLCFDPKRLSEYESNIAQYQEEVVITRGNKIVLHPGRFIIGSTLEYIALPKDVEAQIEGRSSWARLGLTIATATTIHPIFKGIVTLELSNNGTIPIELSPGVKIAQMIFHLVDPPLSDEDVQAVKSRYQFSIGPGFSKIYQDNHLDYFYTKDPSLKNIK